MRIVVQKYGGALLATPEGRLQAAEQIAASRRAGHAVVTVASAIGRHRSAHARPAAQHG
jgi:aspartate kinase